MRVREERVGSVAILEPVGDLDATALPAFDAVLRRLLQEGTVALIWDLSAVGMIPSTVAGFLIQAVRRLREAGGRMALASVHDRVRGTLRTMGVAEVFRFYPDRAAALRALQEKA